MTNTKHHSSHPGMATSARVLACIALLHTICSAHATSHATTITASSTACSLWYQPLDVVRSPLTANMWQTNDTTTPASSGTPRHNATNKWLTSGTSIATSILLPSPDHTSNITFTCEGFKITGCKSCTITSVTFNGVLQGGASIRTNYFCMNNYLADYFRMSSLDLKSLMK